MTQYWQDTSEMVNSQERAAIAHQRDSESTRPSIQDEKRDSKPVFEEYLSQLEDLTDEDREWLATISPREESRIFRKVDLRLIPILWLINMLWALDKSNIGNAKIEGLQKSLHMNGVEYDTALMIFFIPYLLLEIPSNIWLSKVQRPSVYIGVMAMLWGASMTLSGTVQTGGQFCVARFFLGLFEAGFIPATWWVTSIWYPPQKLGTRAACLHASAAISGAISGLLAAGLVQMDGVGGYEGWRWIFIIEGLLSTLVGVVCIFCLPDSPSRAGWLSEDETRFLEFKHIATRGAHKLILPAREAEMGIRATRTSAIARAVNLTAFKQVVADPLLWLQSLLYFCSTTVGLGMKFTLPSIIKSMGFTSTHAQLLTVPPYILGAISGLTVNYFADRSNWRLPFVLGGYTVLLISYTTLFNVAGDISHHIATCYTMVCFACMGFYPLVPCHATWATNNMAGAAKRNAGIAFVICLGSFAGIPGSFMYKDSEKPGYATGYGTSLALACVGIMGALTLEFLYRRHNRMWENVIEENTVKMLGQEELDRLGDKSPLFKYSL